MSQRLWGSSEVSIPPTVHICFSTSFLCLHSVGLISRSQNKGVCPESAALPPAGSLLQHIVFFLTEFFSVITRWLHSRLAISVWDTHITPLSSGLPHFFWLNFCHHSVHTLSHCFPGRVGSGIGRASVEGTADEALPEVGASFKFRSEDGTQRTRLQPRLPPRDGAKAPRLGMSSHLPGRPGRPSLQKSPGTGGGRGNVRINCHSFASHTCGFLSAVSGVLSHRFRSSLALQCQHREAVYL